MIIYGDGNQTRDFINVKDVVDINIKSSEIDLKSYGDAYNVGTGKPISILSLSSLISDNIQFAQTKIGELKYSSANIEKTITTLNWKPTVKLESWLKNNI